MSFSIGLRPRARLLRSPLATALQGPIYGRKWRKYSPAVLHGRLELETNSAAWVLGLWDSGVLRQAFRPEVPRTPSGRAGPVRISGRRGARGPAASVARRSRTRGGDPAQLYRRKSRPRGPVGYAAQSGRSLR